MTEQQKLFKERIELAIIDARFLTSMTDEQIEEVLCSVMHGIDGYETTTEE